MSIIVPYQYVGCIMLQSSGWPIIKVMGGRACVGCLQGTTAWKLQELSFIRYFKIWNNCQTNIWAAIFTYLYGATITVPSLCMALQLVLLLFVWRYSYCSFSLHGATVTFPSPCMALQLLFLFFAWRYSYCFFSLHGPTVTVPFPCMALQLLLLLFVCRYSYCSYLCMSLQLVLFLFVWRYSYCSFSLCGATVTVPSLCMVLQLLFLLFVCRYS